MFSEQCSLSVDDFLVCEIWNHFFLFKNFRQIKAKLTSERYQNLVYYQKIDKFELKKNALDQVGWFYSVKSTWILILKVSKYKWPFSSTPIDLHSKS